jgi:uncharacterized protein DUF3489
MGCRQFRRRHDEGYPMTKPKTAKTKARRGKMSKRRNREQRERPAATKTKACLDLLSSASGATIGEMQKATGWQPHSVRGFLAGTVKKKLGLDIASTKEERGRVYRIAPRKGAA